MKEQIRKYYEEYKAVFDDNFRLVIELFDKEAIHKMRTAVKRFRVLFQFIGVLTDAKFKPKKQLKRVRRLFKLGGKIREIQIEQQIVSEYEQEQKDSLPEYMEYLRTREFREISRFLKHLPTLPKREKIIRDDKVTEAIDSIPENEVVVRASGFIEAKLIAVSNLLAETPSNHRIHRVRTYLKQIYYLYDQLETTTDMLVKLKASKEQIRETEQVIGLWHDLVNSRYYLNGFFKSKNFNNKDKYRRYQQHISRKRKEMRQLISKEYFFRLRNDLSITKFSDDHTSQ